MSLRAQEAELFFPEETGHERLTDARQKEKIQSIVQANKKLGRLVERLRGIDRIDVVGSRLIDEFSRLGSLTTNPDLRKILFGPVFEETLSLLGYKDRDVRIMRAGLLAEYGVRHALEALSAETFFQAHTDRTRSEIERALGDTKDKNDFFVRISGMMGLLKLSKKEGLAVRELGDADTLLVQVKSLPIDHEILGWAMRPVRGVADIYRIMDDVFDPQKWQGLHRGQILDRMESQMYGFEKSLRGLLATRNRFGQQFSNIEAVVIVVSSPSTGDRTSLIGSISGQPVIDPKSGWPILSQMLFRDLVEHFTYQPQQHEG